MLLSKRLLILALGVLVAHEALAQKPKSPPKAGSETKSSSTTSSSAPEGSKEGPSTANAPKSPIDEVIDRIVKREQNEMTAFSLFKPIVETYVQELKPEKDMAFQPYRDYYYLGQADLARGVFVRTMLPKKGGPLAKLNLFADDGYLPGGFLQMMFVDRHQFDQKHYEFHYAGRQFLGEVRCLVFDINPTRNAGHDRFKGRIWVEDRDFTIVRFNGVYAPQKTFMHVNAHFDSWRLNVQPDLWVPAYVFSEELNPKQSGMSRFKSQTRYWAWNPKAITHEDEFSDLFIDSNSPIQDASASEQHDRSPVQAQREFLREGEDNTIDTLARAGLIAPEGEVDKVLNTVLNNLEATNNLNIEPEPRCRVMLTSNIELFSVGHTIVLSRGLLDVLPDESTLAAMLAQELSDAMIFKPENIQYGFSDYRQTATTQTLSRFSFKDNRDDREAVGRKTLELLRNSPYRGKLETAALFFLQLNKESKLLPHLISPTLGNRVYVVGELMNSGPVLEPTKIDQVPALPMGARIKLDPWTDQIEMVKARSVPLQSAREKMPFEVTPFMPYLTRYAPVKSVDNAVAPVVVSKEQPQPRPEK
jgi:hypothetical protein